MTTGSDLEKVLLKNINDDAAWQVYADYLQSQGDIRGELINLEYGLANAEDKKAIETRIQSLLKQHQKELLGEAIDKILQIENSETVINFSWKKGFIEFLKVAGDYYWDEKKKNPKSTEILEYFLQSSSCKFLQTLHLGLAPGYDEGRSDFSLYTNILEKHGSFPVLENLHIGAFKYHEEIEISWTTVGAVYGLYPLMPELRYLHVQGGNIILGELSDNSLPKLEKLIVETGGLLKESVDSINNAKLSALKTLKVYFGDQEYGAEGNEEDLGDLLQGNGYPNLSYLGLLNSEFTDNLVKLLVDAEIIKSIEILDISLGTLTDEGAEIFIENSDKFQHLKKINLHDNFLSEAMIAQLKNTFKDTEIYEKDQKDAYEDEDESFYYVSVGE